MSISQFYLCAIPEAYWEKEIGGVDIAQFAHDALGCERRIAKEINLENEYARYTLLCQQLEREVINRGKIQSAKNAQDFKTVIGSGHFAVQPVQAGYLTLVSRGNEATTKWRFGSSFYLPSDVSKYLKAFATWVTSEGVEGTAIVQQYATFFQWAAAMNCGVIELQSGFHLAGEQDHSIRQQLLPNTTADKENGQYIEIPDFVLSGLEVEFFGGKGRKQHYAKVLRKQIQEALKNGEPVSFGNQAPHDVITEVLHEFVFVPPGETINPVNLRIMYADGSEAEPFPLSCLSLSAGKQNDEASPLRVSLMSMRHLEMDSEIDFCWLRNREVSRTRTLSETDQFCFDTTLTQFKDSLKGGNLALHLFHTGFEPAIIGFYRGVVHTLLNIQEENASSSLSITPFYFRGPDNPYQTGSNWK